MFLDPDLISNWQGTLLEDCRRFLPELILCSTIVLLLLLRLFAKWHLGMEAFVLTAVAFAVSCLQWQQLAPPNAHTTRELFGGLIVYDTFTVYLRLFLLSFTALIILLSLLTGIPDAEDSADFYCLLLGATVGMSLMASANHLMMIFVGIEMASLPSYALAGFLKGKRRSSEASLKYVVYGGGAAGVMLYGISLIAGKFGTGYLPDLAQAIPAGAAKGIDPVVVLGLLFILIGIAFKLAAVPFQFWCPDVFEGAAAEVAGYLSVASKGAALALLARVVLMLSPVNLEPGVVQVSSLATVLVPVIALLAALTATFGNLAAYPQTNLKRLLAYSTIAHAGYMMMGLAPLTTDGTEAVLFYLIAYLVMNLGAFACVAFIRNATGSEDLRECRGLVYKSPLLVVVFAVFLLSLLGLPPLAGFAAKFQVFRVLFKSGQGYTAAGFPGLGNLMYALLVIGGLNTVFSAVYYVRVLKVMCVDKPLEEVEGKESPPLPLHAGAGFFAALLAGLIVLGGVAFDPLLEGSQRGVVPLHKLQSTVAESRQPEARP